MFDESPVTKQKVQLLDGRYGPYVADGETNASLPKGTAVEELTFQEALICWRLAPPLGPSKKKWRRRKPLKAAKTAKERDAPKKSATKRRVTTKAAKSAKKKS